jgi:hypothetical protein
MVVGGAGPLELCQWLLPVRAAAAWSRGQLAAPSSSWFLFFFVFLWNSANDMLLFLFVGGTFGFKKN